RRRTAAVPATSSQTAAATNGESRTENRKPNGGKPMKSVRAMMIVAFAALLAGTFAIAQSDEGKPDATKGDAPHGGRGPGGGPGVMLDHLLPQPVVDDLKLTAEQKTKYIDL